MSAHPPATIDFVAEVAPYVLITGPVRIGARARFEPDVDTLGQAESGSDCRIHIGAVTGDLPQDLAFQPCEPYCRSGSGGVVREHVTPDRGKVPKFGANATFTRSTPLPGHNVLAGAWTVSTPGSRMREILTDYDDAGAPVQSSSRLGTNARRTETVPKGTATVVTDSVTLNLDTTGTVSARDDFRFNGAIERDDRPLTGTVSIRPSGGNITVTATERQAVLARVTSPPTGAAQLQGTWEFVPRSDDPPSTTLRLAVDAQHRLTRIVFGGFGQNGLQFTDLATRTDQGGGIITIKASFSGGRSLFFDGVIGPDSRTSVLPRVPTRNLLSWAGASSHDKKRRDHGRLDGDCPCAGWPVRLRAEGP